MKLDILVLALLASEASAVCIFGFGCDQSSSSGLNGYNQLAVDTGSASPSQTQGSGNSNSSNNNNNSNSNTATNSPSSTTTFMTTGTSTSTSVTADGGTNGISAFPATTWNGPHLRSTATNTYGSNPTNANNGGNSGYGNSGYGSNNNNSSGSKINAGAVAGGVIGALIVIGAAAGLIFFLYRRSRDRREKENYGTKLTEADFAAGGAAGPTLPSAAYNETSRYDNGRRYAQQKNPYPPPIGFNNITPTQKTPPYHAEYGQTMEKPSEDTAGGAWKPDVAESKPNV